MEEKKKCKYCQEEIEKGAKICPRCKKKQGLQIWQVILVVVVILIILIALLNGNNFNKVQKTDSRIQSNTTNISKTETKTENKKEEKEEIKFYGLDEEVILSNSKGKYAITITGIKEMTERNEFSDQTPSQVFLIDYSYKNIEGEDLYISDSNFTIIDQEGEIGDTYPNSKTNYPKYTPVGATCKAQMIFGIHNESNKIRLQYKNNMFQSKADITFEIEV